MNCFDDRSGTQGITLSAYKYGKEQKIVNSRWFSKLLLQPSPEFLYLNGTGSKATSAANQQCRRAIYTSDSAILFGDEAR